MRGHIEQRSPGSYSIIVRTGKDPVTGKWKQQRFTVKGTKRTAEKRLAEILHQIDTGNFVKPEKVTLTDYLERWLKDYAWSNRRPSTADGYQKLIRRYIEPALGKMKLTDLKPMMIQTFLNDLKDRGLSDRTREYCYVTIHIAFECAIKWQVLLRNPCDGVTRPPKTKHHVTIMNIQDEIRILNAVRETIYYPLYFTLMDGGLRRGEALALRWPDVDFDTGTISIRQSLTQQSDNSLVFGEPKTEKSRRPVPMTKDLYAALMDWKIKQASERLLVGQTLKPDDLVFSHEDGGPLFPNVVTRHWSRICQRLNIKGVRLHDCRHTFATVMLKETGDIKTTQELLGHSSAMTTLDTYAHVVPGLKEAAVKKFGSVMSKTALLDSI